jgi:uncharacterized protein (UPF0335 family)
MTDTRFAKDHLKAFIERIERLEEEKKAIADDIRDVYAEAKSNGFDVKALRAIVKLRKIDADERREHEAILETYMHALGMLEGSPEPRPAPAAPAGEPVRARACAVKVERLSENATQPKPPKPLGMKAYGSIGHLPCSRIGPGDHFVHAGQQTICTEKPRRGDRIIVTEKLDGACMSVANIGGELIALSRAGYRAGDALYEHLKIFDDYVRERADDFAAVIQPGERLVGEWLAMAHGTLYDPACEPFAPFVAFDLFRDNKRVLRDEFMDRVAARFRTAAVLSDGPYALCVDGALAKLIGAHPSSYRWKGHHGALDEVEGAVWRVEREGRVDFLAKFVRHEKTDGKYLPNITGAPPIWFWRPPAPRAQACALKIERISSSGDGLSACETAINGSPNRAVTRTHSPRASSGLGLDPQRRCAAPSDRARGEPHSPEARPG